jgi:rod shape-determining protein MreB and related proteins
VRLGRVVAEEQLAVDLGTANTVVFRRGEGIVLFEPSVVAIDEWTGEVQAVGEEARRMIGRTPARIRATRPLRHGVITDFETTEQMLRHFIRKASGRRLRRTEVIVCVPSGITQVERRAVEESTLKAGARNVFLIEEPLAGAIGAGLPVAEPIGSLVVDIGGGTSEMAVIALGGMVIAHSLRVGGYELDEAIVRLVHQHERLLIGQEQAEALKLEIGNAVEGQPVPEAGEVAGRDIATGLMRRATISADQVREALARPLNQIVEAVELVLEQTPAQLSSDIATRGLTLLGGGALLAGIDELLHRHTGLPVETAESPLLTVAQGAGRALEEIETLKLTAGRRRD